MNPTSPSPSAGADRPWILLQEFLDTEQVERAEELLSRLSPPDTARCLARLDEEHRSLVLARIRVKDAAEVIEQISDAQGSELLERAAPEKAAAIVDQLRSDDQADILASMPADSAEEILAQMRPATARAVSELAAYPAATAGGVMVTEFLAFDEVMTAGGVVTELRRRVDEIRDYAIQYIFVTHDQGKLVGVLRMRDLLLAPSAQPLRTLMIPNPIAVPIDADLDDLFELFERYSFLGVPVVDDRGHLRGIVQRSEAEQAWGDRAESSRLKAQGIVGGEELRTMPTGLRSRRRLSWLSVNIVLNLGAASVIAAYQDTLEQMITLAVFLPIISDMSGCSGNQAVAVSMRELTLGVIKPVDVWHVWRKEFTVGLINGTALGSLVALLAWAWQGDLILAAVVGTALAVSTLVAVLIGGGIPLLLKRLGRDPALASGPILTTLTDMCGFVVALSLAAAWLAGRS